MNSPGLSYSSRTSPSYFTFGARLNGPGTIDRVVLLRPAAVTHHFDNDQRYIELPFATAPDGTGQVAITATAPTTGLAPPG